MIFALADMVSEYHAAQPALVPRRPVIRPVPVDESGFTVQSDGEGGFVVRGRRPERWIAQTAFDNDEAVGYLGDRLARLGVEDELVRLGARPGCAVTIGEVTFDWEPQTPSGIDTMMSDAAPTCAWKTPTASAPTNARRPGGNAANTVTGRDPRRRRCRAQRCGEAALMTTQRARLFARREASWSRSAPPH